MCAFSKTRVDCRLFLHPLMLTLLMTCFGVPATEDADLEVVERCELRGFESGSPIFSLRVAPQLDLLITGELSRVYVLFVR